MWETTLAVLLCVDRRLMYDVWKPRKGRRRVLSSEIRGPDERGHSNPSGRSPSPGLKIGCEKGRKRSGEGNKQNTNLINKTQRQ